jgi:two-component system response regulator YesN
MKSILIVDDEYLVRLGLKTTIDWAEFGYVIAGEAGCGADALEIFDRVGADVILTDIKMPGMDGLELTKAVRERNKKTTIIILSHYDEFAYAQEAVALGAFRYILKSELTKTNLVQLLKSLFITRSAADDESEKALPSSAAHWEDYIENNLLPLFSLARNDVSLERVAASLLPELPPVLSPQVPHIVLSAYCRATTLAAARKMFPKTVKALFTEAFSGAMSFGDYSNAGFKFVALLPAVMGEEKCFESCSLIVKNVRQYYDTSLFVGMSGSGAAEDARRLFTESQLALDRCFFSEKDFVSRYESSEPLEQNSAPHISYTKLAELLERNKKDQMLEYIQNMFRELRKRKSYAQVHDAFIDFLSIGKLLREKYQLKEEASLSESKFNYAVFDDLKFIGDVEFYIYGIFLALLAGKQGGEIMYSYGVKRCLSFIQQNYAKNISLSDAAKSAELSPNYLSFLFKQETGINFNNYLSQFRVEQAKKLLASSNLRIYQVAEEVGFSNPYYFSTVFKEFTGLSCKQYRDHGALP